MADAKARLDPVTATEFAVPSGVTAPQLTEFVADLFNEQVRSVAMMYESLIADLEKKAGRVKRISRDEWLNKNLPANGIGHPDVIRKRMALRPACPLDLARHDIPESRTEPRPRGVYLKLRQGFHLEAEMWAVDSQGDVIAEANVIDNELGRLDAARFLWSVLERRDPSPRTPTPGR
ncbi:MAG TPA: hypothetical protein VNW46_19990 [Gemmatimonadaceae bacterium]|jgi:hypothetical protein|nr:hypothetical protein [Gemmatimonadaceae bacterium]